MPVKLAHIMLKQQAKCRYGMDVTFGMRSNVHRQAQAQSNVRHAPLEARAFRAGLQGSFMRYRTGRRRMARSIKASTYGNKAATGEKWLDMLASRRPAARKGSVFSEVILPALCCGGGQRSTLMHPTLMVSDRTTNSPDGHAVSRGGCKEHPPAYSAATRLLVVQAAIVECCAQCLDRWLQLC